MDEKNYVRSLAEKVHEISLSDEMNRRRDLWRRHNSLEKTEPPIFVRAYAAAEVPQLVDLACADETLRQMERHFKSLLYKFSLGDDCVIEPWYAVRAVFIYPEGGGHWGFPFTVTHPKDAAKRGAFIFNPHITEESDIKKIAKPVHAVDEQKTSEAYERISELLYGAMPVVTDRAPLYTGFAGDISTDLAYMRGIEGMMWDMADRPEWLHKVTSFMGAGILNAQSFAEEAGDFNLFAQENQAVSYAKELPAPRAGGVSAKRSEIWSFGASQETAAVSPSMWEEFIFRYQKPVLEKYGLTSYGCCEDMTRRIPILKRELKNLRRVTVTPWADARGCAQ
ncbi:MAG: hypothetical protein FWE82_03890, partial [Defluviitaleaceae bacterium]|nr:hypothetical protein [Defluviitaleaceae bacterium]